jgi:adenine-specific DNA-methyltransferase
MAHGESKTKWNGSDRHETEEIFGLPQSGGKLRFEYDGKLTEAQILSISSSRIETVWSGCGGHNCINSLYVGDNLGILAALREHASILGNIRLVYIDPPFSTGAVFHTRSQRDAYMDLLTGTQYIEFMRRRLVIIRELLAEDGSIYVHIDHNIAPYLKVIMDEIFGEANFRNWITRKKSNPKNYTRNQFGNISDVILFYTKSSNYVWNRPYEKWTNETALKEYQYIEQGTGRRFKKVPIHAPGVRNGLTGKPWREMLPPPGKHWQFPPSTLDEMDARGEIAWSENGNPRRKIYLDESEGKPIQDIWLDYRDAFNQNHKITGYPTEKNQSMLEMIIQASSNPGDIVLDCFSGSGTTLVGAANLNRRWIGVDKSMEAIFTTLKRFAHGSEPMGDFVNKRNRKDTNLPLFQIMNFSLLASVPVRDDLYEIIKQWKEWIGIHSG